MRLKAARTRLRAIVERASADAVYMKELQASPVEVLVKEGLPYDVIEDFLRETQWHAEVSGYAQVECANTCALTHSELYPEMFSTQKRL